ncbi:hypothetical protein EKO27_g5265 [Xylaria grammica]|uniref:DUF7582 domain-containing protein n=1 Tax=Xylaria grammica TaxID=363999 RepID=A0A439D609_9PEZI|nr:hypothetical protein EKO27_g5265 [Xylaria grammica]
MDRALDLLSHAIKKSDILMAVAPIRYISFGGAVSVKVFQSRESTEDIDILLDPSVESVTIYKDEIRRAISAAATKGNYESDWFSDACRLFIAEAKRPKLFQKSLQQNVVLYKSESLVIYAASFDCALERKLRRLDSNLADRDHSIDLSDAVSLVHALRRAHPLRKDYVQSLDLNECRVPIQPSLVDLVASEYFLKHHQLGIVEMTWHEETQCHTYTNQKGEVSFVPRYLNSLNDERDVRNNTGYVFTFK